jgi:hypothetical protein
VVQKSARGWLSISGALSILAGIAVLAGLVWKIGFDQILDGLVKVGWAFPVIVALGGLRFFVRAWAWSLCIETPHRLGLRHAFAAVLAGDALGNVSPLGPVVGEPAKVAFARTHLSAAAGATALAIENLFYTLATAGMIAAGTLALLVTVDLPPPLRDYSELAVIGIAAAIIAVLIVFRWQPALISRWLPKLHTIERDVYSFAGRRRATLVPVAALELAFHALGVLETHLTMWMILPVAPPLVTSFILETASRLITVLFKFIPMQIGVAQTGLAGLTTLLGYGPTPGAAFSLVRVARQAVWAVVGAALLVRRGITPRMVLADQDLRADTR